MSKKGKGQPKQEKFWHRYTHAFKAQQELLKNHPVTTIFDVGANVGQSATAYRCRFPEAAIHCFEPFSESSAKTQTRHQEDSRVIVHQMALSNRKGIFPFHINQGSTMNSLLTASDSSPRWSPPGLMEPRNIVQVETNTVDLVCQEWGIERVDILKIDTQGTELWVLEGAAGMLSRKQIGLIYCEVPFVPFYEGQAEFFQIAAYLHQWGYRLFDFFDCHYALSGQLKWADALFITEA